MRVLNWQKLENRMIANKIKNKTVLIEAAKEVLYFLIHF